MALHYNQTTFRPVTRFVFVYVYKCHSGIHIMRTNIFIDDKLMRDALRATGFKTKHDAVEEGLRTLVRLNKQAKIRNLRGKLHWKGDLDSMRRGI